MPAKSTIIFIQAILISMVCCSQQTSYFNKLYDYRELKNLNGNVLADLGSTVIQLPDSDYILVGTSWDAFVDKDYRWITRINNFGDTIWLKEIGIADTTYRYYYYYGDIQWDADSNLIILETTYNKSLLSDMKYRLIKINLNGDTLWTKNYKYSVSGWTVGIKLIKTSDNGYAITGFWSSGSSGPRQVYLAKLDSSGNKQWDKLYGGANNDEGFSLVQTKDSGFLIAGYTESYGAGDSDFFLFKTDSSGTLLWQKTFGGSNIDAGYSIISTIDSGYILAGAKHNDSFASSFYINGWLIKVDKYGNKKWERVYGGDDIKGYFYKIIQLEDSSYVTVGGFRYDYDGIDRGWIMKMSSNGDSLWSRSYNRTGKEDEYFWDFRPTQDKGFVICGMSWPDIHTNPFASDAWLIKLDSLGLYFDDVGINKVTLGYKDKIKIYPNPFNTFTTIEILEDYNIGMDLSFVLYNLLGMEVKRIENISSNKIKINRDYLPPGLYFYKLAERDQIIATGKLAIQ
ncbi:MAG: T9SS type A sorting domain-containing protein [Bacteroidetes bacterium]|nr:T9SS type A sorting domain-containing protein [Bacteroidota bacterium]